MSDLTIPDLAGKSVMITGASTGIGAALARAFAAQGARVGVHYHSSQDAAMAVVAEIEKTGGTAFPVQADAADPVSLRLSVEAVARHFGGLDGLINNAGGMVRRIAYEKATEDDYDEIMDFNARSVLSGRSAAIPHLKKQGGFIINTTSIAARNGASGGAGLYGSSKAFVSQRHARDGQGTDCIRYSRQCRGAWRDRDAVPRSLFDRNR